MCAPRARDTGEPAGSPRFAGIAERDTRETRERHTPTWNPEFGHQDVRVGSGKWQAQEIGRNRVFLPACVRGARATPANHRDPLDSPGSRRETHERRAIRVRRVRVCFTLLWPSFEPAFVLGNRVQEYLSVFATLLRLGRSTVSSLYGASFSAN